MLILDESTSALDPEAEIRIIEDLRRTFVGRTSLVLITHRPASASIADQVIWLSGGRVAAIGGHEDLMQANDAYRNLWTAAVADA
jgi:ATP-binding cassette subfamily B protein